MNLATNLVKSMKDVNDWEEAVAETASEIASDLATRVLSLIDDELLKRKDNDLKVVGFRDKTVVTKFGELNLKRRLYCDDDGQYKFLLDEALGIIGSLSASITKACVLMASKMSFRDSRDTAALLLPRSSKTSHSRIHKALNKLGAQRAEEDMTQGELLFEHGLLPESAGRKTEYLFIEADGAFISLQNEKERKAEVKLAVAHEGWMPSGKDYALKAKTVHCGLERQETFSRGTVVSLAKKYELSSIKHYVTGGDGASWVKDTLSAFPGSVFELCKYHILKSLREALTDDERSIRAAYQAAISGDSGTVLSILDGALHKAKDDKAQDRIKSTIRYLANNAGDLADWRLKVSPRDDDRGLGAIEGNVDKILANRFKKRGMRWSKAGANHMAKVIDLRENNALFDFVDKHTKGSSEPSVVMADIMSSVDERIRRDDTGEWLAAGMPALNGPHASRPWAKALREMTA